MRCPRKRGAVHARYQAPNRPIGELDEGRTDAEWYYRPVWVLLLLFVVLGPFGLPYLWKGPSFSRGMKVVLTLLLVAYMGVFVGETVRLYRAVAAEMDALGVGDL